MDPLQQLNNELETVANEMTTKATTGDLEGAQAAQTRAENIKSRILILQDARGIKAWQGEPANAFDSASSAIKTASGGSAAMGGAGATVTGFSRAGETIIDSTKALYQDGEGLLTEKQIKTVIDPEYGKAVKSYLRNKGDTRLMNLAEVKMLEEGRDEDGGFLVPADMMSRIIERKPTLTRVAGAVTTYNTGRDVVALPTQTGGDDIYTTGIRVNWTGERGNPGPGNNPKFGVKRIPVYTAMLELSVTNDLLEDSVFPIQSYVADKFRETVDILRDDMALSGSGVGQPTGALSQIGVTDGIDFIKSGDANNLTADGLVKLAYAIPEQYMENCRWLFNRTNTEAAIALLKDGSNRYLFARGREEDVLASARPDSLLGFELIRSALMPNVAAGKHPILFGDLSGIVQVIRSGFTIRVLTEIEARNNTTVLLGRLRMGGGVIEPWKLRALRIAA